MWIEKLRRGILQVSNESGLLYVEPSLKERLKLLWTFRNFRLLPEEVLTKRERQFISQLCSESRLQKPPRPDFSETACVIGTVDRTSPAPKKPISRALRTAGRVTA